MPMKYHRSYFKTASPGMAVEHTYCIWIPTVWVALRNSIEVNKGCKRV